MRKKLYISRNKWGRFYWKPKRVTSRIKSSPPIYRWLWFTIAWY